jgi:tRNA-Thr(GGU) m(6)t(6)A37 methyltransferase TsaA
MAIKLEPIGVIKNEFLERVPKGWETVPAQVVINEKWGSALDGVEQFSHLIILFWLDRIPRQEVVTHIHPQRREDLPLIGLFATRSPGRPNPIAVQVVELLSRQGDTLTVRHLDALDNSPVLDIKPYLPRGDSVPDASTPAWVERLTKQE